MRAENITVSLGRKPVLHGIDMQADTGAFTCIVGPNGSGKTTLLRALTGEVDYGGRVTINGTDTKHLKGWELAAIRGVLPQAASLAFPFTVVEVVRLGLSAGVRAADDSLPMRALARVGLTEFANRFYQELSGGEQQRVQLARVLTQVWAPLSKDGVPRWLLLDEPVSSLDIGHQLMVMELARDYARGGGGVIAVMHDLNLTSMYADKVVMLHAGRVAAAGRCEEVFTDVQLSAAYGCALRVNTTPPQGGTFLLPHAATPHG